MLRDEGTPAAPEKFHDVWGVGAVLYEVVVGDSVLAVALASKTAGGQPWDSDDEGVDGEGDGGGAPKGAESGAALPVLRGVEDKELQDGVDRALESVMDAQMRELLGGMLRVNPSKREGIGSLLRHPCVVRAAEDASFEFESKKEEE